MAKKGRRSTLSGAIPMPTSDRESVSIRKIENGFLIERSGVTKRGEYQSTTEYSAGKPAVVCTPSPAPSAPAARRRSEKPAPREVGYLKGAQ